MVETWRQWSKNKAAAAAPLPKEANSSRPLVQVFCEASLPPEFMGVIDPTSLQTFNLARTTADSLIHQVDYTNGLFVTKLLDTRTDVLTQIDPSFVIEATWFRHIQTAGGLEAKLLEPLATDIGVHDPKNCRRSVVSEAPVGPPLTCRATTQIVSSVAAARMPSVKVTDESATLRELLVRCGFFAYFEPGAGSSPSCPRQGCVG